MDNTEQMVRKILNGQNKMRFELLKELGKLDKKLSKMMINLKSVDIGFGKVDKHLDDLELQITNLIKRRKIASVKRIAKVEQKVASV